MRALGPYITVVFLVVLTFIVFSSSLGNDFISWDDGYYVTENPTIRTFSLGHIVGLFTSFYVSLYVPVTMLSYMVDYHIWMSNPFGYHLTNLILHITNVILAFFFLRKLKLNFAASLIAAAVFAVHPVQVESVAWISQRKSLLSTVLFFLSFFAYIRYSRLKSIPSYVLSIALFAVAGLAKPSVVVLPLLLLGYDYFYTEKRIGINQLKDKLPYFIFAAALGFMTVYAHRGAGVQFFIHGGTAYSHIVSAFAILTEYLRLVFYPIGLSGIYELTVYTSALDIKPLIGLAVAALSVFYLIYFAKKKDQRGFWILWFFILMLPIMHVFPLLEFYSDRYLYVSILTFPVLICSALTPHLMKEPTLRYSALIGFAIVLAVLSFLSFERCKVWKDSFAFWRNVLETTPGSHRAHMSLGIAYKDAGEYEKAVREHKTALQIKPDYAKAWSNLGVAYEKLGLIDEAIRAERRAIELDPANPNAYTNLGMFYAEKGLHDEAIQEYRKAIELQPEHERAYNNLSVAYMRKGWMDRALWASKKAVSIRPYFAEAYGNMGNIYMEIGDYRSAQQAYRRALSINPNLAPAKRQLEALMKKLREGG